MASGKGFGGGKKIKNPEDFPRASHACFKNLVFQNVFHTRSARIFEAQDVNSGRKSG